MIEIKDMKLNTSDHAREASCFIGTLAFKENSCKYLIVICLSHAKVCHNSENCRQAVSFVYFETMETSF